MHQTLQNKNSKTDGISIEYGDIDFVRFYQTQAKKRQIILAHARTLKSFEN